jgi:hypothetical protein
MTNTEADALIATLPKPGGLRLRREGDEIIMEGGTFGGHSIRASVSSGERLLVHWKGYVENQGLSLGPDYAAPKPQAQRDAEIRAVVKASGEKFDRDWEERERALAAASPPPRIPAIGEWVSFPSKSAPSGWRRGQVVKVTPKRVLIAFQFKYEKKRGYHEKGVTPKFDPNNANTTWRKLTEIRAS